MKMKRNRLLKMVKKNLKEAGKVEKSAIRKASGDAGKKEKKPKEKKHRNGQTKHNGHHAHKGRK